jgi:hypothetical protein
MGAEVGRVIENLAARALVFHVDIAQELDARLAAS